MFFLKCVTNNSTCLAPYMWCLLILQWKYSAIAALCLFFTSSVATGEIIPELVSPYLITPPIIVTWHKPFNLPALTGLPQEVWDVECEGLAEQGDAHPLVEAVVDLLLVLLLTTTHRTYTWVQHCTSFLQLETIHCGILSYLAWCIYGILYCLILWCIYGILYCLIVWCIYGILYCLIVWCIMYMWYPILLDRMMCILYTILLDTMMYGILFCLIKWCIYGILYCFSIRCIYGILCCLIVWFIYGILYWLIVWLIYGILYLLIGECIYGIWYHILLDSMMYILYTI